MPLRNPFSLTSAIKFAALFAVVLLLVKMVQALRAGSRPVLRRGAGGHHRRRRDHAVDGAVRAQRQPGRGRRTPSRSRCSATRWSRPAWWRRSAARRCAVRFWRRLSAYSRPASGRSSCPDPGGSARSTDRMPQGRFDHYARPARLAAAPAAGGARAGLDAGRPARVRRAGHLRRRRRAGLRRHRASSCARSRCRPRCRSFRC